MAAWVSNCRAVFMLGEGCPFPYGSRHSAEKPLDHLELRRFTPTQVCAGARQTIVANDNSHILAWGAAAEGQCGFRRSALAQEISFLGDLPGGFQVAPRRVYTPFSSSEAAAGVGGPDARGEMPS